MTFAAHELVRVDPAVAGRWRDAPPWVASAVRRAPWLVVRRERPSDGIPVGVRGSQRTERFAARVLPSDVLERVVPEDLCAAATRCDGRLGRAARSIAAYAADEGVVWGPVGSFGFELATGRQTTTTGSDLDIVVRAQGVARGTLLGLNGVGAALAQRLGLALDVELAFDLGGIASSEYALQPARVLAKTSLGPQLVPCP